MKDNYAVLEDFEKEFWNIAVQHYANYEFTDQELKITFRGKEFKIPYRRFSEPNEKIIEEIRPLVKIRNAQNELNEVNLKKEAWEVKVRTEKEEWESKTKKLEEMIRKSHPDYNL